MKVEPNRVGQFPFRKADPEERKRNFSEVQQPYSEEEVMREADRCLLCGTPVCIDACPVLLDVRGMNEAVARGDFKTAHERIRETNPLLGVTGRCCPQLQGLCEDACVLKWSGQPIGIGLIQRYVADWERKNKQPQPTVGVDTGKKVEVRTNVMIGKDICLSTLLDENDAILLTTGSKDPQRLDIRGSDLQGVIDG